MAFDLPYLGDILGKQSDHGSHPRIGGYGWDTPDNMALNSGGLL